MALNKINKKMYIGLTIQSLAMRRGHHYYEAGFSELKFHRALRKYGKDNFTWTILKHCSSVEELRVAEQMFIAHFNSFRRGYNETKGGEGSFGRVCQETTKQKIGDANRGRLVTELTRQKLSAAGKGVKKPESQGVGIARSRGFKPFKVYDKASGVYIGKFESITQFANAVNITRMQAKYFYGIYREAKPNRNTPYIIEPGV